MSERLALTHTKLVIGSLKWKQLHNTNKQLKVKLNQLIKKGHF